MGGVVFVPKISRNILDRISSFEGKLAYSVNERIDLFNRFAAEFPVEYKWLRMSDEGFSREIKKISSRADDENVLSVNSAYWLDLLRHLEALMVMNVWRSADLGRSAAQLVNKGDIVSGAVVSRALLEGAAFFLHVARRVSTLIDEIEDMDFSKSVIGGQEIEDFVVRSVFGSGKDSKETSHNVAFNVLSAIKSADKVHEKHGSEEILPHYEILSEVAHPNFTGRAIYIKSDVSSDNGFNFETTISRSPGRLNEHVLSSSVSGLSWAMAMQVSAGLLMGRRIRTMANKFS